MSALIAITLIFIALFNILILHRRKERLNVFDKVRSKNVSLSALVESQLSQQKRSFLGQLIFDFDQKIHTYRNILMIGQPKVTLIAYIIGGTIIGIFINQYYIGLSSYVGIICSFIATIGVILFIKKRKLEKEFYENFPEALSIISGVVSSGYAVTTSFKSCGESINGIVGKTMQEIHMRVEVGENIENVLLASYRQLPFPEYYFFILTVMVNLDSGGELKEILNRLSKMLANNRILNKTRDSKTAELRMTMWILAVIPFGFVFLLKIVSPINYRYLTETPAGHYILYYMVSSVFIGITIIKNMINKIF